MWQIEDIIRAYGLDLELINKQIIAPSSLDEGLKKEYLEWFEGLVMMMRQEDVVKEGHLQINVNTLNSISDLHHQLLGSEKFAEYTAEFYRTLPFIVELRSKAADKKKGELETCFDALYGMLLLKLQGKDISAETALAMKQITKFIATLAAYYKKNEEKSLFEEDESKDS